ncbi:SusD/RagB family nutrient-binding outer membrane lipoprotein [Sphingobacterium puteale]|uniref:SusD/RagB family nutrient-binding outer membrane lipoprotein n=1 Tax=Sphingobacterium puteale TaxID=2420510 RepID=A0A420VUI8_9SPHI|nr:SusD/RagB family nutrient-binding outer membrane lipoprotein [Sphingobacterium puteale]RKO70006.1 SusD/RagB family nutrient-binding outer membrane lipoprotein [Sphingobacterium puteale]
MKINITHISSLFLLLGLTASCKDELAKINKNQNEAETPQPAYLLTSTIKTTTDSYWGVSNNLASSLLFVQHWARVQYTDPDRYIFTNNDFNEGWSTWYSKSISQLKLIQKLVANPENNNYKGVSLVLQSWIFSLLTDAYGDIPYTETGDINNFLTPRYETQESVYRGILNDLKNAQSLLKADGEAIQGDIIYGGNIINWKQFANSLRLRFALRIADRLPDLAKTTLQEVAAEGSGYIKSNDEIAQLIYQDAPNRNPVSSSFEAREDYRVSKTMVDKLVTLRDPRLEIYADTTLKKTSEKYIGLPNGLTSSEASSIGFDLTSRPGIYFRQPKAPAVILSYSEVLFGLSEAVSRGFITGDAADLYQKAIRASLEQYKISNTLIDAYLRQPSVRFDPNNYKKSIGEQKWIALYGQGLEAFAEWRRLDYPQLTPAKAGALGGKIPTRFLYPGTEQSLNGANYQEAIKHQGSNSLLTKLWFDKE